MADEFREDSMKDLLKDFDVKRIKTGEILKGQVIDVNDKEVAVNINYAFDGVISREELTVNDKLPTEVINKGDIIDVYVISPNDGEGYVKLSRVRALQITEREDLRNAFKSGNDIKVIVKEETKGGIIAYYGSIRVFIPRSLIAREKVIAKSLIGEEIEVRIIEFDMKNRNIVASKRVIEDEKYEINRKSLWNNLKEGEKREGIVKKILKVGAIVDIGGITGLIHINDLAWQRVNRVEDIVNIGDKVTVFVGNIDAENQKVSLILKDIDKEPWKTNSDNIKVGDVLEGTVAKLVKFGAFIEIFNGIEGLVHINEITDEHIAKSSDVLTVGQKVKVKVIDVNKEDRKISLSIKDALEKSKEYLKYNDSDEGVTLGDLFKGLFD